MEFDYRNAEIGAKGNYYFNCINSIIKKKTKQNTNNRSQQNFFRLEVFRLKDYSSRSNFLL